MKNKKHLITQADAMEKKLPLFLQQKKYSKIFVLTDENTNHHCLPLLLTCIKDFIPATIIKIYAGEQHKNLAAVEYVWKRLTEENANRNAVLINLGGGMVCDLGGFAAATYKRGIDFIHIPTTLLSMVDASIGGKQGIDFMNYKNQIGVFKQPAAIFVNEKFLTTLPAEEITSGFAEVVKHALLSGGKLWKQISSLEKLNEVEWQEIILSSIELKQVIVEADPFEKNLRKILNFGHTIGHAVESFMLSKRQATLHGNCVAAGMIGELYLSQICCGLSEKKMNEALQFIKRHFPNIIFKEADFAAIISLMKMDKKNSEGKINMVLLEKFGQPVIDCDVDESLIKEALLFMIRFWNESESNFNN